MDRKTKVLTDRHLIYGNINSVSSKIDNAEISRAILKDEEKQISSFNDTYQDIQLNYIPMHDWVIRNITENFQLIKPSSFLIDSIYANVERKNQNSFKRSTLLENNMQDSPHYTVLYICNCGYDSGKLFLEYKNEKSLKETQNFIIEEGNYYIFNSDVEYYFSRNKDEEPRIYITGKAYLR